MQVLATAKCKKCDCGIFHKIYAGTALLIWCCAAFASKTCIPIYVIHAHSVPPLKRLSRSHSSQRREIQHRRREDALAAVLIGIVTKFIVCHGIWIFLSIHEALTIKRALYCDDAGKRAFPFWAYIARSFSDLFLALNVSTNCIIYCALDPAFRRSLLAIFSRY